MQHVQHMDAWGGFVVLAYAVFLSACTVGAFSRAFQANLAQRLALALFAAWSAWRTPARTLRICCCRRCFRSSRASSGCRSRSWDF